MKKTFLLFILLTQSVISFAQWRQENGPCGGWVTSMVSSDSVIYVAGATGIYSSADSGKLWKPMDGTEQWSISQLVVAGNYLLAYMPNSLFIYNTNSRQWTTGGTGLTSRLFSISLVDSILIVGDYNKEIMTSSDTGKTWTKAYSGHISQGSFTHLGDTIFAGCDSGVYMSTDKGHTWRSSNNGFIPPKYIKFLVTSGDSVYAISDTTLYTSVNHGASWAAFHLPIGPYGAFINHGVILLSTFSTVSRSTDNGVTFVNNDWYSSGWMISFTAYRGYIFASSQIGMFVSADNGATWREANNGIQQQFVITLLPYGNNIIAGTGDDIFLSPDKGNTWSLFDSAFNNDKDFLLVSGNDIFAGTGFSIANIDSGKIKVVATPDYYDLFLSLAHISNTIFAGSLYGIYRSVDNGKSWAHVNDTLSVVNILFASGDTLYAGTANDGLYQSIDYGVSWTLILSTSGGHISALAKHQGYLFAAVGNKLLSSNDDGKTWQDVSAGLTGLTRTLTVSGNNIYAGTEEGVFVSSNNGSVWTNISGNMGTMWIESLLVNGDSLYAGTAYRGLWIISTACQQPVNVNGATALCTGEGTTLTASGAFNYEWLPGSVADSVLTVPPFNSTSTYTVTATTAGGCSVQSTVTVNVSPKVTAGNIAGPVQTIPNSYVTYSTTPVADAQNYTWSVPQDWYIISGQGTDSITVYVPYSTNGDVTVIVSNFCNSDTAQLPVNVIITAATTLPGNNIISLFPNPTADFVTVSLSQPDLTTFTITDVAGRVLTTEQMAAPNHQVKVFMPAASGIYFLHIVNEQTNYTAKVVRE